MQVETTTHARRPTYQVWGVGVCGVKGEGVTPPAAEAAATEIVAFLAAPRGTLATALAS